MNFDERLDRAVKLNILGPLTLLALAQRRWAKQIKSFVHVSTAYVAANQRTQGQIQERVYELDFDPSELLATYRDAGQIHTVEAIERHTSQLLGLFPNTYTLTKACAESMVARYVLILGRRC